MSATPPLKCRLRVLPEDFKVFEVSEEGFVIKPPGVILSSLASRQGLYSLFMLEKLDIPHFDATRWVARILKVHPNALNFAGIKDARAHTCQLLTVSKPFRLHRIDCLGEIFHNHREVRLLFLGPYPRMLYPGANRGNLFEVTVRGIPKGVDVVSHIERTLEEAHQEGGIPNYFGYQRFGVVRPNTHLIGKYILLRDYESALMELLAKPYPLEGKQASEARRYLRETLDFRGALRLFPKHLVVERTLLRYLSKHPRNYAEAFKTLPRWLREIFVQAYQSYLFNRLLSKRLKLGIPLDEAMDGEAILHLKSRSMITITTNNINWVQRELDHMRAELCLKIPGYEMPPSNTFAGELMKELLEEEGVPPDIFRRGDKIFPSLRGSWRVASIRFPSVSISTITDDELHEGSIKALLRVFLNRGVYVTTLLRELFKPQTPAIQGF